VNAVNLADHAHVERFIGNLRALYGGISGVIHLLPLRDSSVRPLDDRAAVKARINSEVKGLFHLLKETRGDLAGRGRTDTVGVIAATRMGGRWSLDFDKDIATVQRCFAPQGAIAGLLKTAALEWPEIAVRAVDFNTTATPEEIGHRVFDELRSSRGDVQVGYAGKTRLAVRHALASSGASAGQRLSDGSVILASGGGCGITAEVIVDALRETRDAKVVLLGRTPAPSAHEDPSTASLENAKDIKSALLSRPRSGGRRPSLADVESEYRQLLRERELRRNIARMSELAVVQYEQADVQHEASMRDIVARVRQEFGRLDCVIHAAGVIQDKLITDKSSESFSAVFDTKVDGALSLARAVSDAPPSLMIFFSSTAAVFGNRGQADYAAANAALDALASQLHSRWGTRVLSINWGPWSGAGMVGAALERQLRESGTKTIDVQDGVAAAHGEIFAGERHRSQVIYTGSTEIERMPGQGEAISIESPSGNAVAVADASGASFDSSDDNLAQAAAG
jgi:NAD(P)-dependent dehydrogenase (short-subunit alcohol dehydrogenase family)